jgi:predicted dehydrogenase
VSAVATKPRLGFLGVGWIGRSRLEAIERSGLAEIAAIADPAVVGSVGSLDELVRLGLDGLAIATPSALHAEQAEAALRAGLAVFCQKPLGLNAAETAGVVQAARTADRLLGVDLSYRSTAAAQAVRELVRTGAVGEVFAADLAFHNAYGPDKRWFYDPALSGGGCLIDLGIHLVDLALWTLDWPRVQAVRAWLRGKPVEDYAVAELELASGALVRIACSWNLHAGTDAAIDLAFHGSDGGAALRNVGGSFYEFVAERNVGRERQIVVEPPDEWFGRAAVEWAARVAADERYDPEIERVVEVVEVLDELYRSAAR